MAKLTVVAHDTSGIPASTHPCRRPWPSSPGGPRVPTWRPSSRAIWGMATAR